MSSNLDILTPKGRETAELQMEAIDIILKHKEGTDFIHTAMDDAAAIDGFFVKLGEIRAAAEIKCRLDMDVDMFFRERKGEWLITAQKIYDLRNVCDLLKVPGFGILYIVRSKLVLMKKIITEKGFLTDSYRVETTQTQRTVNGGKAVRENAFVAMHNATQFR